MVKIHRGAVGVSACAIAAAAAIVGIGGPAAAAPWDGPTWCDEHPAQCTADGERLPAAKAPPAHRPGAQTSVGVRPPVPGTAEAQQNYPGPQQGPAGGVAVTPNAAKRPGTSTYGGPPSSSYPGAAGTQGLQSVSVTPGSTHPGGRVSLRSLVACPAGTAGKPATATVVSPVLSHPVTLTSTDESGLVGTGTVATSAKPGYYDVYLYCDGRTVSSSGLQVVASGALGTGGGWGSFAHTQPVGSSADAVRANGPAAPGALSTYGSAGLAGGAALVGALALRRRLSRRTADRG